MRKFIFAALTLVLSAAVVAMPLIGFTMYHYCPFLQQRGGDATLCSTCFMLGFVMLLAAIQCGLEAAEA